MSASGSAWPRRRFTATTPAGNGVPKPTFSRSSPSGERLLIEATRQITADHLRPLLEPLPPGPSDFRLDHYAFGLCQASRQASVQAGLAPGPGVIAVGPALAADLVKASLTRLADRLAELARRSGAHG